MAGGNRARDRPVLFFCLFLGGFMHVRQLPLFTHQISVRSWCGHHWLVLVWRGWDGSYVGEYLIEKVG